MPLDCLAKHAPYWVPQETFSLVLDRMLCDRGLLPKHLFQLLLAASASTDGTLARCMSHPVAQTDDGRYCLTEFLEHVAEHSDDLLLFAYIGRNVPITAKAAREALRNKNLYFAPLLEERCDFRDLLLPVEQAVDLVTILLQRHQRVQATGADSTLATRYNWLLKECFAQCSARLDASAIVLL